MAGLITHLVYAQKAKQNNTDFTLGSMLTDINYIKAIDRYKTHVSIESSRSDETERIYKLFTSSVSADLKEGFIFHSLTEHDWAKDIWIDSNSKLFSKALKLYADEVFWDYIENKETLALKIEEFKNGFSIFANVEKSLENKWLDILGRYIANKPINESRIELAETIEMPKHIIEEINKVIDEELKSNESIKEALLNNWQRFTY